MVVYQLVIKKKALEFLNALPLKSQRIKLKNVKHLHTIHSPARAIKR